MKKTILMVFAATGLLLGSCAGTPESKQLGEIQDADVNDSVAHYWGQMLAARYWDSSKQDTTLSTPAGKEAYMKGFQAAMDMVKVDDEAYNMGLYSGLEAALGIVATNENFLIDVDKATLLSALAWGMESDTTVNIAEVQEAMQKLTMRLQMEKEARDRALSDSLIAEKMKAEGFKKNAKGYVCKAVTEGKGNNVEPLDRLLVELSFSKANGMPLIPSAGPSPFVVDQNPYGQYINDAVKDMTIGSTYQFLSVAADVFGRNVPRQYGIGSSDLIVWTAKVVGYCDEKGEPSETPVKAEPLTKPNQPQSAPVRK